MDTKEQIIERLEATGAMTAENYNHEELLEGDKVFERALLKEVFQDEYSDSLRAYDLVSHVKSRATQHGLSDNQVLCALIYDLEHLSREIGSLVNGARGEQLAHWALQRLPIHNEKLCNIQLCHEGEEAEYDDIVITPHGVFIVEAKFYSSAVVIDSDGMLKGRYSHLPGAYNVGERMQSKEYVLWKTLENALGGFVTRDQIHGVLLNTNKYQQIEDEFGRVPVKSCGSVNYYIGDFTCEAFTEAQIQTIKDALLDAAVEIRHEPALDYDRIRRNFAETLVLLDGVAKRQQAHEIEVVEVENPDAPVMPAAQCVFTLPRWAKNTLEVVGGAAAFGGIAFGVSRIPQIRALMHA